jgi:hypothetical protein
MSNVNKVYSQITGRQALHDKRAEQTPDGVAPTAQLPELELSAQNRIDWLQHPRTQQMFEDLGNEAKALEKQAFDLVNSTLPSPQINFRLIEHSIVRADCMRNIIRKYSKSS